MKNVEQPVTVESPTRASDHQTTTTHPAFGMLGASRVNGHQVLFGSDFIHNGFVMIRIYKAELHRDLSHDWYHPKGELIEVAVSEAQWATFVSSMNNGFGVPCTLQHINRTDVPKLPDPQSRTDQFQHEAEIYGQDMLKELEELRVLVADLKVSQKQKDQLTGKLSRVRSAVTSGMPFLLKSFAEHAEKVVEKAKIEVSAYTTRMVTRLGLSKLAELTGDQRPMLEWKNDDDSK